MRNIFIAMALSAVASSALAASPGVTMYTDRTSFNAAAGPLVTDSFNDITQDTEFDTAPLVRPGYNITVDNPDQLFLDFNFVDVPAYESALTPASYSVDGTALLNMTVGPTLTVTFNFASPITAFGFDTRRMQNDPTYTEVRVAGETLLPPVLPSFLGFVSVNPFTSFTFAGQANAVAADGFSIDNVSLSATQTGAIPEPSSWALLIAGFGLTGAAMRRRRRVLA